MRTTTRIVSALLLMVATVTASVRAAASAGEAGASPATSAPPVPPAPSGLKVGDAAPDAELVDASTNAKVRSSTLWAQRPVVVVFYRGGWCPYCTKSLSAWQGRAKDLEAAGAALVAVAMEKPSFAERTREKHKLDLRLLSDPSGEACRVFRTLFDLDQQTREKYKGYGIDLVERNQSGTWQLPVPATYVIDAAGVVRFVHFDPDYTKRADPDEVIAAVKALKKAP